MKDEYKGYLILGIFNRLQAVYPDGETITTSFEDDEKIAGVCYVFRKEKDAKEFAKKYNCSYMEIQSYMRRENEETI